MLELTVVALWVGILVGVRAMVIRGLAPSFLMVTWAVMLLAALAPLLTLL